MAATLGPVTTLFPSTSSIAAHSPSSFNLLLSLRLLLRRAFGLSSFLSPSLPFSFPLLYLFILLGRRPLFVPWCAGRLAARSSLDVAPSNTFALETATFDDVLLKRVYSALPRLEEERRKEGVSTWQVHTSLRSGPANFGYSPCQHRRSFSWRIGPSRHLPIRPPF